jgi:hypothetical protein
MTYQTPPAISGFSYVPYSHRMNEDVFIDMQYAKHDCKVPTDFAAEPWRYCKDPINTYLSLRFEKRALFKSKLDATKLKLVENEEERIAQTRVNFSSYKEKQRMMFHLKDAWREWKKEVKDKRAEHVTWIQEKENWEKIPKYPARWKRSHSLDVEPLERVGSWKEDDELDNPGLISHVDPEYGFKARAIYFRKSDSGWKGHTHHHDQFLPGNFPNQKIPVHNLLEDLDKNPLSEPCPADYLRYFHFPANNMRWIEVWCRSNEN